MLFHGIKNDFTIKPFVNIVIKGSHVSLFPNFFLMETTCVFSKFQFSNMAIGDAADESMTRRGTFCLLLRTYEIEIKSITNSFFYFYFL